MSSIELSLLDFFNHHKGKINRKELIKSFNVKQEELELFDDALNKLETLGNIYSDDFGYMCFPNDDDLVQEKLHINKKKEAFIVFKNNVIYIPDLQLLGALEGDIVIVKKNNFKINGKEEGFIKKIVKRNNGLIAFEVINDGKIILKPYRSTFNYKVNLDKQATKKLVTGDIILVKVDTITNNQYNGQFINKIGHKDDANIDIRTMIMTKGIDIDFSDEALAELEAIPTEVTSFDMKNRTDLRDKLTFTIDGATAKDIDDAISLEINDKGNYMLGVHIAALSHYIKPGSTLFNEACNRANSVYLVDSVIPMFPHQISNGICSLNPNVDRLAKTCMIEYDVNGKVINYEILDSVIRSDKKMTYEDVNKILDNDTLVNGYEAFIPALMLMRNLSNKLNKQKNSRGYLDFGDNDITIKTDETGLPISINPVARGTSEKIIENFMLAANEIVASHISNMQLPGIYRIHDVPDKSKIAEVMAYINLMGYKLIIPGSFKNPKTVQDFLNKLAKLEEFPILSNLVLRSMKRATYSTQNIGHFGLALENYTHFTAPIRRSMDLITHTLLDEYSTYVDVDHIDDKEKALQEACTHATIKERLTDEVEKEVNEYKMAEYMEQHIGGIFESYITYISRSEISIKTLNAISGKVSMHKINEAGLYFDSHNISISTKDGDICYKIGDKIMLTVTSANKEERSINFKLVEDLSKIKVYKKTRN
ncbi:MAG: ribonuclease R [Bacilli bacterium]